jgi:hypothetical protein
MRIKVLPDSIRVSTVDVLDPTTGQPTGEKKEVLSFTVNFGLMENRPFTFDMPVDKAKVVAQVKSAVAEILENRRKADAIRAWLSEHGLLEVDTDAI